MEQMKVITLTNGTEVRVSDEDHDRLSGYSWSQFRNGRAYRKELIPREVRSRKTYRTLLLHREIMGVDDPRKVIFRDGDPTHCVRENLVVMAPNFQPRQRGKKGGSSQYRGVGWNRAKGMWQAFVRVNGKLHHLGFFAEGAEGEKLAAVAYDEAAQREFGEMAILNFEVVPQERERPVPSPRAQKVSAPAMPIREAAPAMPKNPYEKPVAELTPDELEEMKARFLGERYRGKLKRAG
jgi:hypothetical protein